MGTKLIGLKNIFLSENRLIMPQVWNIGNTTVRNPYRIESGLKVFVDEGFEGNVHGKEAEARFTRKLAEHEVIDTGGSEASWLGRKWRSVFVKLGLVSNKSFDIKNQKYDHVTFAKKYAPNIELKALKYELTPVGQRLLNATTLPEKQDIFLRQFICHELPNGIEGNFPYGKTKPFILFLQVLKELENRQEKGLNKYETAIFVQPFQDHKTTRHTEIVDRIIHHRNYRRPLRGRAKKRKFDHQIATGIAQGLDISANTLKDYSDTTFRYFGLTGVLSKDGQRVVIRDSKKKLVDAILAQEPNFMYDTNPKEYFEQFYTGTTPLPTDDAAFAVSQIENLQERIKKLDASIRTINVSERQPIQDLQKLRYELTEKLNTEREKVYAEEQQDIKKIEETIQYLEKINNKKLHSHLEIYDYPAYLEWATWRAFLAIDHFTVPAHTTRRFPVDEDFFPTHTAPGGGSDLLFEFDSFRLVVEVTLTTGERQLIAEGEPVRRHVSNYINSDNKDTYCLFIAPSITNNLAETYRLGTYYRGDDKEIHSIVPITITSFTELVRVLTETRYSPNDIKEFLDNCLTHREQDAPIWKTYIEQEKQAWIGARE